MIRASAIAAFVALVAGWIAYTHLWRDARARPLAYRDLTAELRGLQPARQAGRVFSDAKGLARYARFAGSSGEVRLPRIDFARDEAVLFASGPRSSSGYTLRIERAVEERGRVLIVVRESSRPARAELTYPYRLVVFRRLGKPVDLEWQGR